MLKPILRTAALLVLCVLLVYAPEIFAAVSAPYAVSSSDRILLRITLCTRDEASADALYDALHLYMKEFPSIHLRITRTAEEQLFAQSDPQPDVFVFSSDIPHAASDFAPLTDEKDASYALSFFCDDGETLLCAVHRTSLEKDAARTLVSRLIAVPAKP